MSKWKLLVDITMVASTLLQHFIELGRGIGFQIVTWDYPARESDFVWFRQLITKWFKNPACSLYKACALIGIWFLGGSQCPLGASLAFHTVLSICSKVAARLYAERITLGPPYTICTSGLVTSWDLVFAFLELCIWLLYLFGPGGILALDRDGFWLNVRLLQLSKLCAFYTTV